MFTNVNMYTDVYKFLLRHKPLASWLVQLSGIQLTRLSLQVFQTPIFWQKVYYFTVVFFWGHQIKLAVMVIVTKMGQLKNCEVPESIALTLT